MPAGRITSYTPELCDEIVKRTMQGEWAATDEQIADYCGIDRSLVRRWRHKYPEFDQAVRKAKLLVDNRVESALFYRASTGDVSAGIYWLQCRRPAEWRNKHDIDVRTPDGIQMEHTVPDVATLVNLPPEKKAALTRSYRAYLLELRECSLLPNPIIDVENDEE